MIHVARENYKVLKYYIVKIQTKQKRHLVKWDVSLIYTSLYKITNIPSSFQPIKRLLIFCSKLNKMLLNNKTKMLPWLCHSSTVTRWVLYGWRKSLLWFPGKLPCVLTKQTSRPSFSSLKAQLCPDEFVPPKPSTVATIDSSLPSTALLRWMLHYIWSRISIHVFRILDPLYNNRI